MAKAVESWRLFWLIALAASVATCAWLPLADFHSARGIAPMIQRSVRYALPLFLLAFTASSLAKLWPSQFTKWLLRNRRYIGLGFAFAMAWHLGFVGYSVFSFGLYASALSVKATALDLIALTFLVLLTLTSFRWFARRLTAANWRLLHKAGVYVIWFVTTYIYLGDVVLRGGDALHDVALTLLIAAWLLRVIAWAKRRGSDSIPASAPGGSPT
jgi:hypothetical protein